VHFFNKKKLLIYYLSIQIFLFNESAPERLVACDKDVISIPYPLKDMNWDKGMHMINEGKIKEAKDLRNKGFYRYPMKVEDNSAIKIKNGVIKVEHSPTGFYVN